MMTALHWQEEAKGEVEWGGGAAYTAANNRLITLTTSAERRHNATTCLAAFAPASVRARSDASVIFKAVKFTNVN